MSTEHTDTPETDDIISDLESALEASSECDCTCGVDETSCRHCSKHIRAFQIATKAIGEIERERNEARVPLCVGKPIIQILAKEGQYLSDDKRGLIAADCLFRKDPYEELDRLRARVAELEEAIGTAMGLIVRHHEVGVRQVSGCFCPVCHREDGSEPELDAIQSAREGKQ